MKKFKNVFTTRRNNLGLFFQLSVFALFAMMTLFSGQISAQQTCTTTVTEGNLFPGGLASFFVTSEAGSVTVDHVNAGTGLQSFTVVSSSNAIVNIPAFTPGTFNPVTATFTVINPNLEVDFTLRVASSFHAANIRVRCAAVPTPTPTPQTCVPTTSVTEGNLFPGGLASFFVTSEAGSVTVDHVNAGTGLQSFTVVSSSNAIVNIPAFTPGTFNPVTATYTVINPNLEVDFTLRAASSFHAANIRVRCAGINPTPTPTPSGTPTPTPTPSETPTPTPTPTATPPPPPGNLTSFSGRATSVNATLNGVNVILNDTGPLPSGGGIIRRDLPQSSSFSGSLTTQELDANTQAALDQSRAQAIVYNLYLALGGNIITSDVLAQSSSCTCLAASSPPFCDSGLFANLFINGVRISITGEFNQRVDLPGGGYVIIHEQIRTGSGNTATITANALHVITTGEADIIFSSAQSGIFCGTNLSPDPADEEK